VRRNHRSPRRHGTTSEGAAAPGGVAKQDVGASPMPPAVQGFTIAQSGRTMESRSKGPAVQQCPGSDRLRSGERPRGLALLGAVFE